MYDFQLILWHVVVQCKDGWLRRIYSFMEQILGSIK